MSDPEDTQPGLTQGEDGVISIGPKASKHSQDKAAKEALDNAQAVVESINEEGQTGTNRIDDADPTIEKP